MSPEQDYIWITGYIQEWFHVKHLKQMKIYSYLTQICCLSLYQILIFFFFCQPVTKTLFDKDRCETSKCPATVALKGWECSTKGRCFQGDVNGNHCLWSVALPNLFDSLHDYNFENIYFIVIYNISVTSSIGEHGKCHDGLLSTMRFSQQ